VAARHGYNASEVEDIAHDALVRAWRFQGSLKNADQARGWLARITVNEARRRRARVTPESLELVSEELCGEDELILSAAERLTVTVALSTLSEGDQLLLSLHYEEDLTQAAIASRLGMPVGTVKVRLHRARGKLHRALEGS
jgi:RNA polymerase sigma-70 factor (ECF subfamily)